VFAKLTLYTLSHESAYTVVRRHGVNFMNWEALGAVGELLGSLILLGSLLYVGIQIRDTKRQMISSASQSRTDSFFELWKLRFEPGFMEAELKSRKDPQSLTELEREMLINFIVAFLTYMQNLYFQRKFGALDEALTGTLDSLPLLEITPYYRTLLLEGNLTRGYSKEFTRHIENVMAQQVGQRRLTTP